MTGFYRDGYCRVGPEDGGNHAVAGTLSSHPLSSFFPPPPQNLFRGLSANGIRKLAEY